MAVKDTVAEWVLTTKEPFRASDAAVATGENIVNVRTALSVLKTEGIVESVERGIYRHTGVELPEKSADAPKKERKARVKVDPLESATTSLKRGLEGVLYEMTKTDAKIGELTAEIDRLKAHSEVLAGEADRIKRAFDALQED